MATFGEVLTEIQDRALKQQREAVPDIVRRRHMKSLHELTGRNVVIYYSSWLTRPGPEHYFAVQINDEDKHGFMAVFAGLDFTRGLDLVMHTPGGDVAATESIIEYIRSMFADDVRIIVPQISMSGGTMISLVGKSIIMGKHSNLGPIDPQIGNMPAIAILEEFDRAKQDITANPNFAALWLPILQKYEPTLLSRAKQAIEWTREIADKALRTGTLIDSGDKEQKAKEIVDFLLSSSVHKAHGRHIHRDELTAKGLNIIKLEDDDALQDAVLSVHHAAMLSMSNFGTLKIIENHSGIAHMKIGQTMVQLPIPIPQPQPLQPQPVPVQPAPVPMQPPTPAPVQIPILTPAVKLKLIWQILRAKRPKR